MTNPETRHDSFVRMTDDGRFGLQEDGNTLYGYLAVFNQDTRISNAREGDFTERISPGAFTKTIEERGDRVKILYDHGFDPHIGNKPLGKPSVLREDNYGLYVEVPLDDTTYNRDLKASLKSGALSGMSFRFTPIQEEWSADGERRELKEVVLHEGGPVTFEAYQGAVAGLRSAEDFRAWRLGHATTIDTTSDLTEAVEDTSVSEPPLEALVNPARHTVVRMEQQLMEMNL